MGAPSEGKCDYLVAGNSIPSVILNGAGKERNSVGFVEKMIGRKGLEGDNPSVGAIDGSCKRDIITVAVAVTNVTLLSDIALVDFDGICRSLFSMGSLKVRVTSVMLSVTVLLPSGSKVTVGAVLSPPCPACAWAPSGCKSKIAVSTRETAARERVF